MDKNDAFNGADKNLSDEVYLSGMVCVTSQKVACFFRRVLTIPSNQLNKIITYKNNLNKHYPSKKDFYLNI